MLNSPPELAHCGWGWGVAGGSGFSKKLLECLNADIPNAIGQKDKRAEKVRKVRKSIVKTTKVIISQNQSISNKFIFCSIPTNT